MSAAELKPVQAEAEDAETITIEWEGLTLALPASPDDWDADVLEHFENNRDISGLRGLLGSKAYNELSASFQAKHRRKLKRRDIAALGDAVARAYGFENLGE